MEPNFKNEKEEAIYHQTAEIIYNKKEINEETQHFNEQNCIFVNDLSIPKENINDDVELLVQTIIQEKHCPNILNYQMQLIHNLTELIQNQVFFYFFFYLFLFYLKGVKFRRIC